MNSTVKFLDSGHPPSSISMNVPLSFFVSFYFPNLTLAFPHVSFNLSLSLFFVDNFPPFLFFFICFTGFGQCFNINLLRLKSALGELFKLVQETSIVGEDVWKLYRRYYYLLSNTSRWLGVISKIQNSVGFSASSTYYLSVLSQRTLSRLWPCRTSVTQQLNTSDLLSLLCFLLFLHFIIKN